MYEMYEYDNYGMRWILSWYSDLGMDSWPRISNLPWSTTMETSKQALSLQYATSAFCVTTSCTVLATRM